MSTIMMEYKENVSVASEAVNSAFLEKFRPMYKQWGKDLLPHLRDEEETMTIVDSYEITAIDKWRKIMPFVIDNLPMPIWKTRYVKTLLWALPMRAQEIGLTLYLGLERTSWQFLALEVPEIIPRGLPGHKRIY
eukprot:gene15307-20629_t